MLETEVSIVNNYCWQMMILRVTDPHSSTDMSVLNCHLTRVIYFTWGYTKITTCAVNRVGTAKNCCHSRIMPYSQAIIINDASDIEC